MITRDTNGIEKRLEKLADLEGVVGVVGIKKEHIVYSRIPDYISLDDIIRIYLAIQDIFPKKEVALNNYIIEYSENHKLRLIKKKDYDILVLTNDYVDIKSMANRI